MEKEIVNIRIAGIGGMGVLTSTLILAETLFRQGKDVKKAEVHGMSQRGGSVCSDVRCGTRVFSPMIPFGETDYLVLFEEDQLPLYEGDCSPRTVILRPGDIDLSRLPSKKSLNIAMLGLLSGYLDIPEADWFAVLRDHFPDPLHAANETAFRLGQETGRVTAQKKNGSQE